MSLRVGYVVAVHPEDHSVDVLMADNGERLIGVQVLTHNGSTRTGRVDLPDVPYKKDKWDITQLTGQDMKAVIGYVGRTPIVTGFLYPQINQMLFNDPKLRIDRHQSDVISTVDGGGNMQITHPSGWYLRVGDSPDLNDLSSKNADKSLAVDRNTGSKPYVRLFMADGTAVLTISPEGKVDLHAAGSVSVHSDQAVNVSAEQQVTITGNANVHIISGDGSDAKVSVSGNAEVKSTGFTQYLADGQILIKSQEQVRIQSPGGVLIV